MSGDMMFGKCDCCGKDKPLHRTYFYYPIKCQCHNNQHAESIDHCADCVPKKPEETKVWLSMQQITQLSALRAGLERIKTTIEEYHPHDTLTLPKFSFAKELHDIASAELEVQP